ncbi:MAG: radical SAM protein [Candidatus Omnitrophota bacterium]|jgi:organic radical activating enzyme
MKINSISIFLTRRCNYRCPYCSTDTGPDPEDKLTLTELKDIILQAKSLGARWLIISGQGEPLLDENLFPILDFARKQALKTKIFTNGSLINQDTAAELYRRNVSVVYKLHALKKPLYDSLAGKVNATAWESLKQEIEGITEIPSGLKYLIDAGYIKKRASLFESLLQIETVILLENIGDIKRLALFCRKTGMDFLPEILIETPSVKGIKTITEEDERRVFKDVGRILGLPFLMQQWLRCRFETNPALDISGNIRHCTSLTLDELWNIRKMPLKSMHSKELCRRKALGMISPLFSLPCNRFRLCATRRFWKKQR